MDAPTSRFAPRAAITAAVASAFGLVAAAWLVAGWLAALLGTTGFAGRAVAAQAGLLAVAWVGFRVGPGTGARLRLDVTPSPALLVGLAATAAVQAAGSWAMHLAGETPPGIPPPDTAATVIVVAALIVVLAPAVEALFFRELLQARCLARLPRSAAVAVAALGFGAMHLAAAGPIQLASVTALGIVFGVTRERTGSLGTAMLLHAANNAVGLAVAWSL